MDRLRLRISLAPALMRMRIEKTALYLGLGMVALLFFLPIYWVIVSSVKASDELLRIPPTWWPHTFTLEHHIRVWTPKFARYFLNSLVYAGGVTLVVILTSPLVAFALVKHPSRFGDFFFRLIVATMMVPFAVYVVPLHGLLLQLQRLLGIPMLNTYWGMILPWVVYPFGIFLMRQAMYGVPDDLIDAAKIDGASTLGIFWMVVVPLVRGHIMALAIFSFIFRYNDLLWPLVVASTDKMYPLTVGLMEFIGSFFVEYGLITAAAAAAILPVLVLYIFLQRYIIQGVALTGFK
ncbi:MAG: carbohydrate ABC transporter permease [Chloroflexi bacterium]|nr:carbohydrate ABC transporter permease [Chloroflexota bacterium]